METGKNLAICGEETFQLFVRYRRREPFNNDFVGIGPLSNLGAAKKTTVLAGMPGLQNVAQPLVVPAAMLRRYTVRSKAPGHYCS